MERGEIEGGLGVSPTPDSIQNNLTVLGVLFAALVFSRWRSLCDTGSSSSGVGIAVEGGCFLDEDCWFWWCLCLWKKIEKKKKKMKKVVVVVGASLVVDG
jgi:hypothetical protein